MRIGILSQWYDPEPGPAALPAVYAREFIRQGHEVSVLTGFPNYPDGRLHPGYRVRRKAREQRDGAEVTRVALYPNHSSSSIGRLVNYGSFALSAAVSGRSALKDVDAVWVYNSPVTVSLPLLAHTRFGRTPIFLHVQDLWPDSLIESGMFPGGRIGSFASAAIDRVVRLTERTSTVVGVSSATMRDIILERHPEVNPSRVVHVANPANEELFRPSAEVRQELGLEEPSSDVVEVMYAGAVGDVQGLETLVEAAALLRSRLDIRITVVGDGISRARLEKTAHERGLDNIAFLGRVSQDEIPALIARAAVQVVSLARAPFLAYTTPSKIASLLASGVPIVGHLEGDGAALIRDAGAGITVTPGDAEGLASAIEQLADGGPRLWAELGARGRAYYEENLSAGSVSARIIALLGEHTSRHDESRHGDRS